MKKRNTYLYQTVFFFLLMIIFAYPMIGTPEVAEAATIKISHSEISLPVQTTKLISISGTSKKVTWTSSNKSVATVNSIGIISAQSEGTATITASVSSKTLKCKVTVYIPMSISTSSVTLNAGKSHTLEVIGDVKAPVWSSSNKAIAKVTKTGTVTAVAKGSAVITATVGSRKLTSKITVIEPITISKKSIQLKEGENYKLKVNGISYRATWATSDTSVAIVSMYGTVTALKSGKATITAYTDGEKLTCTVTITKPTGISESSFSLVTGTKKSLTPPAITLDPVNSGDAVTGSAITGAVTGSAIGAVSGSAIVPVNQFTWSSSDPKVATVSSYGIVKAIKPGVSVITAVYGDKTFTYLAIVTSKYISSLSKAPFSAYIESYDKVNFLFPANWDVENHHFPDKSLSIAYQDYDGSNIIMIIKKQDKYAPEYNTMKKELKKLNTLDSLKFEFDYTLMHTGIRYSIKNHKQSDIMTDIGKVFKTQYTLYVNGNKSVQTIYDLYLGKYFIELVVTDDGDGIVTKIGADILNSITIAN